MNTWLLALLAFGCICGGIVVGLGVQRALPDHHLSPEARDVVKLVSGLLATLSALVLGLLIASAKGTYDHVKDGLNQRAARVLMADQVLSRYGPDANAAREHLRKAYILHVGQLFPQEGHAENASAHLAEGSALEDIQNELESLVPADDRQRAMLVRMRQLTFEVAQARWLAYEEASNSTPPALLGALIAWLSIMFGAFALLAPRNVTVVGALLFGALSVATALFLIEEMNRPLDGVIAVSGEPMRKAIAILGR
jgi:hypothetical protein